MWFGVMSFHPLWIWWKSPENSADYVICEAELSRPALTMKFRNAVGWRCSGLSIWLLRTLDVHWSVLTTCSRAQADTRDEFSERWPETLAAHAASQFEPTHEVASEMLNCMIQSQVRARFV